MLGIYQIGETQQSCSVGNEDRETQQSCSVGNEDRETQQSCSVGNIPDRETEDAVGNHVADGVAVTQRSN